MIQYLTSPEMIPFIMGFAVGFMLTSFVSLTVVFGLERLIYKELSLIRKEITKSQLPYSGSFPDDKNLHAFRSL
jgi:hypothetical protein